MKRRKDIYPVAFLILLTAVLSLAFQELESEAAAGAWDIFDKNCSVSSCHEGSYPPQGLSLEKERFQDSLIGVPSREIPTLKLVDTEYPGQSYLLMKIKGSEGIAGSRMPANSPPLEAEEISAIERWVQSLEDSGTPEKTPPERNRVMKPAFWGTRLVNLPTSRSIGEGDWLFRVSHRFYPAAKEGYDSLYGLDGPASVLLGIGYGFSDRTSMSLSLANAYKEWELALKWKMMDLSRTETPLSLALRGSLSLITLSHPGKKIFRQDNLRVNVQASLAYRVHPSVSLLLVPGYSSNTDPADESYQGTLSLGLGGRVLIFDDFSLLLEWIPVLSGYSLESAGWGVGLEKKIGGHVFQVFALNSAGISTSQYVPGGDFRISDGEFRFGFTIFRWF